jgi:hypothetical protein
MAEWFETLDAEHQEFVTSKGWNKPASEVVTGIAQAYREAQKFIGSDPSALMKLPKDATDPSYQGIYDRVVGMGLPKTAEEYSFADVRFKNGSTLDAEDTAFLRDIAVKNKLSPTQARAVATDLVARLDNDAAAGAGNDLAAKAANDTALRAAWSSEYDQKAFSASKTVDALAALGIKVSLDGLDVAGNIAAHNGLVALSASLNEAAIHRGGGIVTDPTTGMTPEAARARFDELKQDHTWVSKALSLGTEEARLYANLVRVMAGPPR